MTAVYSLPAQLAAEKGAALLRRYGTSLVFKELDVWRFYFLFVDSHLVTRRRYSADVFVEIFDSPEAAIDWIAADVRARRASQVPVQ